MRGRWQIRFALFPHAGDWLAGGVPAAAEAYRHGLTWAHGAAARGTAWPPAGAGEAGFSIDGRDLLLSSLRRREDGWLEVRIVNLAPEPRRAVVRGALTAARSATILGVAAETLALDAGALTLELGPAEIRTIQVQRTETARSADLLDASGSRQHA
jgi:alpha-mannosidase